MDGVLHNHKKSPAEAQRRRGGKTRNVRFSLRLCVLARGKVVGWVLPARDHCLRSILRRENPTAPTAHRWVVSAQPTHKFPSTPAETTQPTRCLLIPNPQSPKCICCVPYLIPAVTVLSFDPMGCDKKAGHANPDKCAPGTATGCRRQSSQTGGNHTFIQTTTPRVGRTPIEQLSKCSAFVE